MAIHYHVTDASQGGYLPDANYVHDTYGSALNEIEALVLEYVEQGFRAFLVSRSPVYVLYGVEDNTPLGRVIEMATCDNDGCDS